MLETMSLAAITAVLGAVGNATANEAGKWLWESAGGLVRRITGREVPAPGAAADLTAVARQVHEALEHDPELRHAWAAFAAIVPAATDTPPAATPRIGPSIRWFQDREDAMRRLFREAKRRPDGRPRVALLHGPEGIGTSALAVHWGVRAAETAKGKEQLFPDGQLYVDLRGHALDGATGATAALASLLRQLGLPDEQMPPTLDGRKERFQRYVTDRRLLVVLDHAHSAAQVLPLLTAGTGVFTLVVARHPLPGLDALPVPVGPLPDKDAVRLLTDLAGKEAVAAARAALPGVLARCAGSPFALRAAVPHLTLSSAVAPAPAPRTPPEPQSQEMRPMTHAEPSDPVHHAAEDAYRRATPAAARLYRRLGLYDWPAIGPTMAAGAAGTPEPEAAELLTELAGLRLLEPTDDGRHRFRPGVRRHAERAAQTDGLAACATAVRHTVEALLHLALRAARGALPESWRVPELPEGVEPGAYPDRGTALAALVAERDNLARAVAAAEEFGDPTTAALLARALWPLQLKAGHHEMLLPALRTAVRAADRHAPGTRASAALHAQLSLSLMELRHFDEAEREAHAAVRDERAAGHVRGHASAVEFLGLLRLRQWRFQEAYDCFEEADTILDGIGPGDEGAPDLPRARALLRRHRGRALGRLGEHAPATAHLETALACFREQGEAYNTARTLTDLAEVRLDSGNPAAALPLIDSAEAALGREQAEFHLDYLGRLRERCVAARS
ncbi:tetratricopeptide repeat protein [Streptomyces sp. NPDC002851]